MKTAIYPGTFDPITLGHIDVIQKSLKVFDKIVVAATNTKNKNYLFSIDTRIEIIKRSLFSDLKLNKKKNFGNSF
jgi:pantetheine-phosphate adenylyltransferase